MLLAVGQIMNSKTFLNVGFICSMNKYKDYLKVVCAMSFEI